MSLKSRASILCSQIGYHPQGQKKVLLRSLLPDAVGDNESIFHIKSKPKDHVLFSGKVQFFGEKWGSFWWTLDFSEYNSEGHIYIEIDDLQTQVFNIHKNVLLDEKMAAIALDQLDIRDDYGDPRNHANTLFEGKYLVAGARIWRDCGSNFAEIPSVGIVVHSLLELYENHFGYFSEQDQQRLIKHIRIGSQYIVDSQESTTDPLTNGRFIHSILVNSSSAWEGQVYIWHDIAYSITVLARAYIVIKAYDPEQAEKCLQTAIQAWELACARPYYLEADFDLPHPDAEKHVFWRDVHADARLMYNISDPEWRIPLSLRTREMLPFLWGCTLLYEITGERKFVDKAIEFADKIAERQFVDWKHPIEGAYGNFYEFENDTQSFMLDFAQSGHIHMGNLDPANLKGFIELLRLEPEHGNVAKWLNVLKIYGEQYVKKTAELTPFNIYPVTVYSDPQYGGVKFFQNILHGCTCLYGQIGRNLLDLGNLFNDKTYHDLAVQNIQFVIGLNPGIPDDVAEHSWQAKSLLVGVGHNWFKGSHNMEGISSFPSVVEFTSGGSQSLEQVELSKIPLGSGVNGFSSHEQFTMSPVSEHRDGPKGILRADGKYDFNEDWIAHSHAYVGCVAKLEAKYKLLIRLTDHEMPVSADVYMEFGEMRHCRTDEIGMLEITDLPLNASMTVIVEWQGVKVSRLLETVGGGSLVWNVDFANWVEYNLVSPDLVNINEVTAAYFNIRNYGYADTTVQLIISASGVKLGLDTANLFIKSREVASLVIPFAAGERVMPYLIHIQGRSGLNEISSYSVGKIDNR